MNEAIDFVIPWVDGNDPDWQRRKREAGGRQGEDDREERYRDWETLRFWFRAVEKYTPWVRKVFFVCDQAPPVWLNGECGKLQIVRHEEFIPSSYLPAFSSHPIELNFHRIPGLSERFVYFNDDTFLLKETGPDFFFKDGLPRDSALLNPIATDYLRDNPGENEIFLIPLNNTEYLNRDYAFRSCVRKHPLKWINPRYGSGMLRNMILCVWPRFVGFDEPHLPQAFLKSSFEDAWRQDKDILDATCRHHFRDSRDVNQWLIRYRQLAEGSFVPRKPVRDAVFRLQDQDEKWAGVIRRQEKTMICLNDGSMSEKAFQEKKAVLREAFLSILPKKCAFEI